MKFFKHGLLTSKQSQIRTNNSHEFGQVTIRTLPWHTINPALPQSQCACGSKIEVLRIRNIYHCSPYLSVLSVSFPYISKSFGIFFPPFIIPGHHQLVFPAFVQELLVREGRSAKSTCGSPNSCREYGLSNSLSMFQSLVFCDYVNF